MKKFASAMLCLCMILNAGFFFAQSPDLHLHCSDSIVFEGYRGFPFVSDSGFGFFNALDHVYEKYDQQGNLKERIAIDSANLAKSKAPKRFETGYVWDMGDQIILLNRGHYKLYFFDRSGAFQYSKKIDIKFKNNTYFINTRAIPFRAVANQKDRTLLIPITHSSGKTSKNDVEFREEKQRHYNTPGLVGVFSLEGDLIQVLGSFDAVYRQEKLLNDFDEYVIGQTGEDSVFISFPLGDKVAIYHKGFEKTAIGARGAYFNREPEQYTGIQTKSAFMENNPKYLIEMPYYHDCALVDRSYMVRTYTTAIKDTVQFSPAEIATKQKWLKGELKGCLLKTKHDYEQTQQFRFKPCFVQIFDLKEPNIPLFDGPINIRYPIFLGRRKPDEFLFTSYYFPGEGKNQVVYVYTLKANPGLN